MQQSAYWFTEYLGSKPQFLTVIGGGLTGTMAAIYAAKAFPKKQILLLEMQSFEALASTRNAGFHCFGSPSEILEDLTKYGVENTLNNLKRRFLGMQKLLACFGKKTIKYHSVLGIDIVDDAEKFDNIVNKLPILNELLQEATHDPRASFGLLETAKIIEHGINKHKNAFFSQPEGQLQPLLLLQKARLMAQNLGVKLVLGKKVNQLYNDDPLNYIALEDKTILSEHVIVATNALTNLLYPDISITPGRGLMLASKRFNSLKLNANVHAEAGFLYYRNQDNRILLGGLRNLDFTAEETQQLGINPKIKSQLINYAAKHLGVLEKDWEYCWSGIMAFTPNKTPMLLEKSPKLVVAAGLNGMGMALAPQLAMEALQMACNMPQKNQKK